MADGGPAQSYLAVSDSLSGRRWRQRLAPARLVQGLRQRFGLSETVASALAARGVDLEDAARFLSPSLKDEFPDPSSFADMDKAVAVILDAVAGQRKIHIFADYDVDGASSAALLVRWFRSVGADAAIYVPDRLTEGYGPSRQAFEKLNALGAELVITVDCGAAAHDAIAVAAELELPVVVVDHHLMRGAPPQCAALVNPNRPDCRSGQGSLAAAGVTFVLLAALNREGRRRGLFAETPEPDLRRWLDLAALGAICDVTALKGFNRALAAQGLKVIARRSNPGVAALLEVAGAAADAEGVFTAGFVLGPRINAGGRIGRSDLGARLLSTDDPAEARALAEELHALNTERREVEREVLEQAIARLGGAESDEKAGAVIVAAEGWHPGVIGIVAGRLRERLRKPVIVIGIDPVTGLGKGSGRSQPGVNLGRAVQAAFEEGLLLAGGGHAMAAGLTIRSSEIERFRAFLHHQLAIETAEARAEDAIDIDALVSPAGADVTLWTDLQRLAPFGVGNPEPVLALTGVRVDRTRVMNGGHVGCRLTDASGSGLEAVAWRSVDTAVGQRLMAGGALHVVGRLKRDVWNGRERVRLDIEDIADPRRAVSPDAWVWPLDATA